MVSLWKIFGIFTKIGAFTIGGGYAMIPVIESEMRKLGGIGKDELSDMVVLAQSAPGLLAVNMAVFSGYRLRGVKGSVVAAAGAVLPSFIVILAIAMAYSAVADNVLVQKFFQALRPVAVALILVPMVRMAKAGCRRWWDVLILAGTLFGVAVLEISPVYILLVVMVVAFSVCSAAQGRKRK